MSGLNSRWCTHRKEEVEVSEYCSVIICVWMVLPSQKWRTKIPVGVQWISGLSRGVSNRVALRLFVVSLCILITLLMAFLNMVHLLFFHFLSFDIYIFCVSIFPSLITLVFNSRSSCQETTA